MGLDMYLEGTLYTFKDDKLHKKLSKTVSELVKGYKPSKGIDGIQLTFAVGYWRKANAIHQWFVENVQDGEDECERTYVTREQLKELRAVCKAVLDDNTIAQEKLPTTKGFFFGSVDYDEWYFEDLRHTIEVVDYALSLPKEVVLYYQSSW